MKNCIFGCGLEGIYTLKNGSVCCSEIWTKCPALRAKNSAGVAKAIKEGRHSGSKHLTSFNRGWSRGKNALTDSRIVVSKNPKRSTLKKWLMDSGRTKCEWRDCGLKEWKGELLPLEIDHIDGDNTNNELSNLRLLCPNCHSLTPTWRGRSSHKKGKKVEDDVLLAALKNNSVAGALKEVGLAPKGGNYKRCYDLIFAG